MAESKRSASEEISTEFKTLVDSQNLESLKQTQHLMYTTTPNLYLFIHMFNRINRSLLIVRFDLQIGKATGQQCCVIALQRLLGELFR